MPKLSTESNVTKYKHLLYHGLNFSWGFNWADKPKNVMVKGEFQ